MDNGWSVYFDPKILNPRFYSILFKVVCYRDEDLIDTGRCRRTKLCKVRRRVHRFISFLCFKSLQRMEHLLWFFAAHALLLSLRFPIAFKYNLFLLLCIIIYIKVFPKIESLFAALKLMMPIN